MYGGDAPERGQEAWLVAPAGEDVSNDDEEDNQAAQVVDDDGQLHGQHPRLAQRRGDDLPEGHAATGDRRAVKRSAATTRQRGVQCVMSRNTL